MQKLPIHEHYYKQLTEQALSDDLINDLSDALESCGIFTLAANNEEENGLSYFNMLVTALDEDKEFESSIVERELAQIAQGCKQHNLYFKGKYNPAFGKFSVIVCSLDDVANIDAVTFKQIVNNALQCDDYGDLTTANTMLSYFRKLERYDSFIEALKQDYKDGEYTLAEYHAERGKINAKRDEIRAKIAELSAQS